MKKSSNLTKKIEVIFYVALVVALVFSFLESVTYRGFVSKHLMINSLYIYLLTFVFATALSVVGVIKKMKIARNKYFFQGIFFVLAAFAYIVLKIVNRFTHPNFVFSKIHIQPNNLLWLVILSSLPFLITSSIKIFQKRESRLPAVLIIGCFLVIGFNLFKIYKLEFWALQFIAAHPTASYGERMGRVVGSTFYNYTQFIVKNTPESARILMPPQAYPWPQSGNGAFLRYFVYPRSVGNGSERESPSADILAKIDYVLLDWGETESTQEPYTHGWPKFDVPATETILMNKDGAFGGSVEGNFHYKDYEGQEVWGLIKVKH